MRILLLEKTYQRVGQAIKDIAPEALPVVMSADGHWVSPAQHEDEDDVSFEIAWASRDLYLLDLEGGIRAFMVRALKSQHLRWFHSGGAGVEHPVFKTIADKGAVITNSDSGSIAISEFVVSSVLDVFQPNTARRDAQAAKQWRQFQFREVAGTTWLIVGLGSIGREVATRAKAFGATVIGVRRHPRGDELVDEMVRPDGLVAALPRADVVALCADANPSNDHLVNTEFLAAMKAGSVLVNIARGSLVDESALLASLDQGIPECAILDVFDTEPLPAEDPLWSHPRVRVSGHCAAGGDGSTARGDAVFLANLERYVAGERLDRVVDFDVQP